MKLPVVFDDTWFSEDLKRTSPKGRELGRKARSQFERDGIDRDELLRCAAEGTDGTHLPGCVKTYLGNATSKGPGNWGMVFYADRSAGGLIELQCLAFGVRHQPRGANAWSVYQAADKRLHDKN